MKDLQKAIEIKPEDPAILTEIAALKATVAASREQDRIVAASMMSAMKG